MRYFFARSDAKHHFLEMLRKLTKIFKTFLKKITKIAIILAYFSNNITNHALIFCAFGGNSSFIGNFVNNF